ncbi:hypothetical protein N0V93_005504 [Gnomoniopsis smithogilvyi]|uniref:Protein kinase domain-containing protein n=1 Tax=Gnomoniopsis smithogilvyi TaxID=1191159 RepID=A0A9W8YTF3_9PEZI|nr:hypothetical protein N0V93_005504 [Gnomoniopsis smithogilvyi]
MDPVSAAGLALGVAGVGVQIYTGCIQGIQLLITACDFPEDCKYLNLRLRMEQQRLFAWSETSGLMDLDAANSSAKILASNTFVLHRTTVLDLLVQVQCLFDEFRRHAAKNNLLNPAPGAQELEAPEKDAAAANFPLPARRRDFIRKAMRSLREKSKEGVTRLKWVSFDKAGFETLLARFSTLNDNMTDILDASMQSEIHHTVQDTNRGVLQLHHRISDLSRLVQALNVKLEMDGTAAVKAGASGGVPMPLSEMNKRSYASGLQLLSQLAKFKAFNQSMDGDGRTWDPAVAARLGLDEPNQQRILQIDRSMVVLDPESSDAPRCEALLKLPEGVTKRCWVEWKDYEAQRSGDANPAKEVIVERTRKLAALLHHSPKPDAFRTPHCLGFFDKAPPSLKPEARNSGGEEEEDEEDDISNYRLGLVFERPDDVHLSLPPISLHELLRTVRKPRVTERIMLAHAVAHCLLYLHAVNWLHKGLRSHNIIFFRTASGHVAYDKPYVSGFDFSRPAKDEMTQIPDDIENDLYRHPRAQSSTYAEERERFKRSFDIYSLGVMFVELAYWKTVDHILDINLHAVRRSRRTALSVRNQLLEPQIIEEIGASMGEKFEDATRRCVAGGEHLGLTDGCDETSDSVAAKLSMAFYEDVVQQLGDIRV